MKLFTQGHPPAWVTARLEDRRELAVALLATPALILLFLAVCQWFLATA